MKTVHCLVILGCAVLCTNQLAAETEMAREMNRLQEDYVKALAAATEPLSRRYQESLEQLLKRATMANDTETVAKIREQLTSLQAAASPNAKPRHTRESLHQLLMTSEWSWSAKPEVDHANNTRVTFTKDQFLMSGKPFCGYKIVDPFTVDLDKKVLKFAEDYKSFEVSNWTDGTPRFGRRAF